jgi:tetratricopeptide (TPR) repeat protein
MNNYRLLLLPLLVLGIQFHAVAATNNAPMAQMDSLINSGQFQQAFDLGRENLADWEGDPQFDFLYGLAGLESGEPNEAVFALERVAAVTQDNVLRQRARLELARAYFVTNNLTAAENLFNVVLESNPPANVSQNIQAFLQLIESRRDSQQPSWSWTVASALGSDDNINSATSNGLIDTPLVGQIELNQDGQQTEDNYSNTNLSANYIYPFTRDQSLNFGLNLVHLDNFDTDQFDIDNLRGNVTYAWGDETNRFRHGLVASKVNLDGSGFQDSLGLNSSWRRNWGDGLYNSLSASYTQIRYDTGSNPQNDLRDVDQVLLTAGVTKTAGSFTHTGNLYRGDESPENPNGGSHNGRVFVGAAYSLLYRLNAQHTPYLRASIQDVEHDSRHPVFFNTVREDDTRSLTFGWFWQLQRGLLITGEAAYTDNASNIPLFDYTRFKYQAGFRYQF